MIENVEQAVRENLGGIVDAIETRSPRRMYVDVSPRNLTEAARRIFGDMGARYAIASGLQTEDGFEVLHHFALDAQHIVVSLRVKIADAEPELPSLAPLIKGAEFIEREMYDLLGIRFQGHPNPQRLILSDDWPEGVYPLRRGKPWEGKVKKQV